MKKMNNLKINNPGNVRDTKGNNWIGKVGVSGGGFVIFDTPNSGLRAMSIILAKYYRKYELHSIRGIVGRWAPNGDGNNDEEVYSKYVAMKVGVSEHATLVPKNAEDLMKAMISMEQGAKNTEEWLLDTRNKMALENAAVLLAREMRIEIWKENRLMARELRPTK